MNHLRYFSGLLLAFYLSIIGRTDIVIHLPSDEVLTNETFWTSKNQVFNLYFLEMRKLNISLIKLMKHMIFLYVC